jgi:plastocyanin
LTSKATILIALTLTTLALPCTNLGKNVVHTANATNVGLALIGDFSSWNNTLPSGPNPKITVTKNDVVSIKLTSVDIPHQFVVDVNNNTLFDCSPPAADKCSNTFTPTAPTTYTFTVDFPPGNYTYYCSFHPTTMFGTFRVLPLHDVAVSGVTVSRNFAYSGVSSNPILVKVNTTNLGSVSETFTISGAANSTIIGSQPITLAAGKSMVVTLNWDTSTLARGNYIVTAHASAVSGETNLANNDLTSPNTFVVRLAGDINGDCAVNGIDLGRIGTAFLTTIGRPGYDPASDINNDGTINGLDLGIVGANFLKRCT